MPLATPSRSRAPRRCVNLWKNKFGTVTSSLGWLVCAMYIVGLLKAMCPCRMPLAAAIQQPCWEAT